jgi:DNA-binding response OmpR family regulator
MKILFADDDPILREFAAVHLATETQEVRLAGDGEEALAMLAAAPPDILLLDIEMPRLDGFGVLERMRADPRLAQVPVMVITGREDVRAIDQAFHLGATAFLTKPINWRLLSYQILYVHRASLAEASLRSGGLEGEESQRALVRAVARLAEESRSLLREVEQEGGSRLKTAAFRYRSALAEVVASAAA